MSLSRRELTVLSEVVGRYLRRGSAVSSREVATSRAVGLSPATIRKVLSNLESCGLLRQPHTSAGRVPTDLGLRTYLEAETPRKRLSGDRRRRLVTEIGERRRELVEGLDWVARLIADLTREVGLAVRPMGEVPVLEAVSLVSLSGGRALGIIVTASGTVEKRVVDLPEGVNETVLVELTNYFNRRFHGYSLDAILAKLQGGKSARDPEVPPGAGSIGRRLFRFAPDSAEVMVAGADHLLGERALAETPALRSAVSALEDRDRIARVLRTVLEEEKTRVLIGQESEITATAGLGLVATVFTQEGRRVGAIGVLGSRCMDYARIVPVVELIGDTLTAMLDESGRSHDAGAHYV